MYRVGFGDFFLISIPQGKDYEHILIDCGVTPGKTKKGDIGTIKDAVAHMAAETKKKLALVIMTHRHQDHIVGFSRCAEIFKEMEVDAVWLPYWEKEYDENLAKIGEDPFTLMESLTSIALDAQTNLALATDGDARTEDMLGMLRNATGVDDPATALAADGDDMPGKGGGSNKASLAMLKSGFKKKVKPEYYACGDKPQLPSGLRKAGLEAAILGPPRPDAITFMKLKDLKKSVGQYLDDRAGDAETERWSPFADAWEATASDYTHGAFREWAPRIAKTDRDLSTYHNAPLENAVKAAQPTALFTAVKTLDGFLNNQSLVVLFTFRTKKLLFVGDAQAGNWEYWLYGGSPEKAPSLDRMTEKGKTILGSIDFYKVGHHGSTNSTPITAVEAMGSSFVSMCSTEFDSFGSVANQSEVPRLPLIDALSAKSDFIRSDAFPVKRKKAPVPASVKMSAKKPKSKAAIVVGDIYVDCLL